MALKHALYVSVLIPFTGQPTSSSRYMIIFKLLTEISLVIYFMVYIFLTENDWRQYTLYINQLRQRFHP